MDPEVIISIILPDWFDSLKAEVYAIAYINR